MAQVHKLKTNPVEFDLTWKGFKRYEIRFNDRDYHEGDIVVLQETMLSHMDMQLTELPVEYTGREIIADICSILQGYGLKDGWVILGIDNLAKREIV